MFDERLGNKMIIKDFDNDYLSISEFAEIAGMTIETLRHYDRKGIFHPAKRGVDFGNQYRYYAPTQLMVAKMIRVLTDIGVPLDEIRELKQARTPERIIKLFSKHKEIVADEIRFLEEVHSVISTFRGLLSDGISATESDVIVAEMPNSRIILGDVNNYEDSANFYKELTRFCRAPHEPKLNLSYPIGGYFDSMDEFKADPSQPTRFFSLDPKGHEQKPEGLYLIGYTRCYYCQANDLPSRMTDFARKNGLVFNGPVYYLYLFDEISVTDPDQYLLQVSASIKETRRTPSRRPQHR
ncbi:MAG: MerR family transcriptional regulator [Oscillospiraceae bacterium]|nr:MerR family transcriptional regulator [Oscillospiraceae bacterium]